MYMYTGFLKVVTEFGYGVCTHSTQSTNTYTLLLLSSVYVHVHRVLKVLLLGMYVHVHKVLKVLLLGVYVYVHRVLKVLL